MHVSFSVSYIWAFSVLSVSFRSFSVLIATALHIIIITNAQSAGLRSLVAAESGLQQRADCSQCSECTICRSAKSKNNNKTAFAGTSNENFLCHFQEGGCSFSKTSLIQRTRVFKGTENHNTSDRLWERSLYSEDGAIYYL